MAFAPAPRRDPLQLPVSTLCAHPEPIEPESSLRRAAEMMSHEGVPALIVGAAGEWRGVIDQAALMHASASGAAPDDSLEPWIVDAPAEISGSSMGSEALRIFSETQTAYLYVRDSLGRPMGILTPSRILHQPWEAHHPRTVGGMATPLGVYLTNGQVGAGVGWQALILTGMVMFGFFLIGGFIMTAVANLAPFSVVTSSWFPYLAEGGALVIFLLAIRFSPIAGIHGAEHMVVHAIERGEELRPEIVRRMPRVHPRCGTNLAAGLMLFLGILGWDGIADFQLRLITALIVTLIAWKPIGSLLQHFVTTKTPSEKQLAGGIRSGQDLLRKTQNLSNDPANGFQRVLSSGVLQIISGSLIASGLLYLIMEVLRVPEKWRVF